MPAGETDQRPWGHYVVLTDEPTHKVKRIVVKPGARLSLQRHRHRQEHWFVVHGTATVTRDAEILTIGTHQAVDLPRGAWHRVANQGAEDLVFIEVQTGDSFGEDDIERRQDDYGRS